MRDSSKPRRKARQVLAGSAIAVSILIVGGYLAAPMLAKEIRHRWYLKELAVFHDPNVVDLREHPEKEAYRFFWLSSWGNRRLITVLVHENDRGTLYLKTPDSNEPLVKWTDKTIKLNTDQVGRLRSFVDSNRFWTERIPNELGIDGASWMIEVKQPAGLNNSGPRVV